MWPGARDQLAALLPVIERVLGAEVLGVDDGRNGGSTHCKIIQGMTSASDEANRS
jgi:hypothetical protein